LTYDYFFWGYVKDTVLLSTLDEPKNRIVIVTKGAITTDMLEQVWEEFDYRIDSSSYREATLDICMCEKLNFKYNYFI